VIRLALPKGRNLGAVRSALSQAGLPLNGLEIDERRLRIALPDRGIELLMLKDWDLPLYVEHGIADCGFVGSDVLDEVDGDLLRPVRLNAGLCRLSFIGHPG
jgi:ATP phosphoribosyltransferase